MVLFRIRPFSLFPLARVSLSRFRTITIIDEAEAKGSMVIIIIIIIILSYLFIICFFFFIFFFLITTSKKLPWTGPRQLFGRVSYISRISCNLSQAFFILRIKLSFCLASFLFILSEVFLSFFGLNTILIFIFFTFYFSYLDVVILFKYSFLFIYF